MIACILTTYLPSIFYEKHDYTYSFVYEEYIWLGEKFAIPYETKSLKKLRSLTLLCTGLILLNHIFDNTDDLTLTSSSHSVSLIRNRY